MIFAGYAESEMIMSAMNGSDLYIFPTLEETEGIPIIEACACETKALIRDIGVFSDYLIDGVNVYKAKDFNEFKEKTINIVEGKYKDLYHSKSALIKYALSLLGKGTGNGQAIRDEILVIMHKNHISESNTHFYEQWHQKLHNNNSSNNNNIYGFNNNGYKGPHIANIKK